MTGQTGNTLHLHETGDMGLDVPPGSDYVGPQVSHSVGGVQLHDQPGAVSQPHLWTDWW